jgi:hypothetical protein
VPKPSPHWGFFLYKESASCSFTLKSISNGYFVQIQNNKFSATGATAGVVINTETCGANPTGFGVLHADVRTPPMMGTLSTMVATSGKATTSLV